jgi:SOS-response transcriptional repressor LexA
MSDISDFIYKISDISPSVNKKREISDNYSMDVSGEKIVRKIDALLKKAGLSRADACRYAKINPRAMTDWDKKGTIPASDTLFLIAEYLHTTVEYLLTGRPLEGVSPEILDTARKIAALSAEDREEILALIAIKLARRAPKPPETAAEPAPEYPDTAPRIENDVEFLDWEMIMIPYFGKTAAGRPLDISIPPDEYMPFPRQALKGDPGDYFYLKIQGYSMVDAGINEGDLVVIKRAEEAVDGDIMLVRHENASTLKKISKKRGKTYLCWEDGTGKKLLVNSGDFQVQGTLIWITKRPKK